MLSRILYACGHMTTISQENLSSVTSSDLPDEIWENIIHYVGVSAAFKLASVNRPFLNFVLSTRYREIQWVSFDTKFFSTLQRLQCVANNIEQMRQSANVALFLSSESHLSADMSRNS